MTIDEATERLIRAALEEDLGPGDVTTDAVVDYDGTSEARMVAKAEGVVAGLAVAIPALIGYNYLMNRVRTITIRMENFSSEIISTVERNFG